MNSIIPDIVLEEFVTMARSIVSYSTTPLVTTVQIATRIFNFSSLGIIQSQFNISSESLRSLITPRNVGLVLFGTAAIAAIIIFPATHPMLFQSLYVTSQLSMILFNLITVGVMLMANGLGIVGKGLGLGASIVSSLIGSFKGGESPVQALQEAAQDYQVVQNAGLGSQQPAIPIDQPEVGWLEEYEAGNANQDVRVIAEGAATDWSDEFAEVEEANHEEIFQPRQSAAEVTVNQRVEGLIGQYETENAALGEQAIPNVAGGNGWIEQFAGDNKGWVAEALKEFQEAGPGAPGILGGATGADWQNEFLPEGSAGGEAGAVFLGGAALLGLGYVTYQLFKPKNEAEKPVSIPQGNIDFEDLENIGGASNFL